jgi:hypothetical protein
MLLQFELTDKSLVEFLYSNMYNNTYLFMETDGKVKEQDQLYSCYDREMKSILNYV